MSSAAADVAGLDHEEDEVSMLPPAWTYPKFVKNFEANRFEQATDALFRAVVTGKPVPEVSWTKKGKSLPCSEKYEYHYDPQSGQVSLIIRDLGPGDEGYYYLRCCHHHFSP